MQDHVNQGCYFLFLEFSSGRPCSSNYCRNDGIWRECRDDLDIGYCSYQRSEAVLQGPESAGAKIPIVPIEFSPPLNVVNRSRLHKDEVPKLVKRERHARTKRIAKARNEHAGHQQVDRRGPQDDSQVHAGGGIGTGIWPTVSTAEVVTLCHRFNELPRSSAPCIHDAPKGRISHFASNPTQQNWNFMTSRCVFLCGSH